MDMRIRNSAKCVVIDRGRVLLTRCVDARGEWFCFPGGGQDPGETLAEAAAREFHEETGARVIVGDMLCVLEWHDAAHDTHAVEFYFRATLQPGSEPGMGVEPDNCQVGVDWINLKKLADIDLQPAALKEVLRDTGRFHYLGLVD
jgi:8-oxo-dGTP pyrophosphatase MutT (NUDIX family)